MINSLFGDLADITGEEVRTNEVLGAAQ